MKSIYDMMGRCTHPTLRDSAPAEHVELFFQVRPSHLVPSRQLPKPTVYHGLGAVTAAGDRDVPTKPLLFSCRRWTGMAMAW